MGGAMEVDLPYLSIERNRHGKEVVFVRRHGRRIRIREKLGSPEFLDSYKEALQRVSPRWASTVRVVPAAVAGGHARMGRDEIFCLGRISGARPEITAQSPAGSGGVLRRAIQGR